MPASTMDTNSFFIGYNGAGTTKSNIDSTSQSRPNTNTKFLLSTNHRFSKVGGYHLSEDNATIV
jgi:hypothetical protein